MSISPKTQTDIKKASSHEPGAFAAWGMIIGGLAGAIVGKFFDQVLVTAFIVGAAGGLVGALIERSRR